MAKVERRLSAWRRWAKVGPVLHRRMDGRAGAKGVSTGAEGVRLEEA